MHIKLLNKYLLSYLRANLYLKKKNVYSMYISMCSSMSCTVSSHGETLNQE